MVTESNRISHQTKVYKLDRYGINSSPFPPHIRNILERLNQLDEEQKALRTELNTAAEEWLIQQDLPYYWNLDTAEGPIVFYKRQSLRKGQTKVTHLRSKPNVLVQIKKMMKYHK